ncbi:hypothetical protein BGX23_007695 [Mortierella sp. AD031]|nr:hypothetical protein BGX23_007695 [Mortierella sp. AD031]
MTISPQHQQQQQQQQQPLDAQATRRLYFHQPHEHDHGAGVGAGAGVGVGGPSTARSLAPPSEDSSSSISTMRNHEHVKRSQSTTGATAPQVMYSNGNPYRTYHCVGKLVRSVSPTDVARDRGYATAPRETGKQEDDDVPVSAVLGRSSPLDSDQEGQVSEYHFAQHDGDDDHEEEEEEKLTRRTHIYDFTSPRSNPSHNDNRINPESRDELELSESKVDVLDDEKEDSAGVCIKTALPLHRRNRHQQDQDQDQDQGLSKSHSHSQSPQYGLPDFNRALPPLPYPEPGPIPTTTSFVDGSSNKKHFSLNSLTSRSIFNNSQTRTPISRPDSGTRSSSTDRMRTTSFQRTTFAKGKGTDQGEGKTTSFKTPGYVMPRVSQFDLDVDQFMRENAPSGLETHPYRISLEYDLRVHARAYARQLAEEREHGGQGEEAVAAEDIALAPMPSTAVTSPTLITSARSEFRPTSVQVQPKSRPSLPVVSTSTSPPSQTTSPPPESKRLSNTSRGTARRIIYSADLAQGLPKGHIARESSNFEIVPTKRLSANSARTNNTSGSRSYLTTHVVTTADNLDGVPGGPAPASATLIIRPDSRGKSPRIITTLNNNNRRPGPVGPLIQSPVPVGAGSLNSVGSSESEQQQQHFMARKQAAVAALAATKEQGAELDSDFVAERTIAEILDDLTDAPASASAEPRRAGMSTDNYANISREGEGTKDRRRLIKL